MGLKDLYPGLLADKQTVPTTVSQRWPWNLATRYHY